jgi:deaminated glutathione amidase
MGTFKAAAIQMRSGTDPEENAAVFERMVREAAAAGARYVQTPEMTNAVVRDKSARASHFRSVEEDIVAARAGALAADLSIHVHVGSNAIALPDGRLANRALVYTAGGALAATYDKIHMFDVDLDRGESWRESEAYAPGTEAVVVELPEAKVGLAICYDLRFPQLFRAEALAGAEVLTAPAAFTRQTGEAHWHALMRARAIENGAWMIAAAQGGVHQDGRETYGHSIIIDPWGKVVADAGGAEPTIVYADIDTAASAAARAKIPNLKNAREFGVRTMGGAVPLRAAS